MSVTVDKSGPWFDARRGTAMAAYCADVEETVATMGASMVRSELQHVLRTQTPYYRLQVTAQQQHPNWKITDQGVIYGPWLEGTSQRNRSTRFKGYATFRRTTQLIQSRAVTIAYSVLRRHIGRFQ